MLQKLLLFVGIHAEGAQFDIRGRLHDRADLDADRVVEIVARHFLDRAFESGRVAKGLALFGNHGHDAADGRFELYKLSLKFDNPEARLAHRFPLDMQQVEVKEMLKMTDNSGHPYPAVS